MGIDLTDESLRDVFKFSTAFTNVRAVKSIADALQPANGGSLDLDKYNQSGLLELRRTFDSSPVTSLVIFVGQSPKFRARGLHLDTSLHGTHDVALIVNETENRKSTAFSLQRTFSSLPGASAAEAAVCIYDDRRNACTLFRNGKERHVDGWPDSGQLYVEFIHEAKKLMVDDSKINETMKVPMRDRTLDSGIRSFVAGSFSFH